MIAGTCLSYPYLSNSSSDSILWLFLPAFCSLNLKIPLILAVKYTQNFSDFLNLLSFSIYFCYKKKCGVSFLVIHSLLQSNLFAIYHPRQFFTNKLLLIAQKSTVRNCIHDSCFFLQILFVACMFVILCFLSSEMDFPPDLPSVNKMFCVIY